VFDIPDIFDEIQGICQAVSEQIRLLYRLSQAGQVYMDPRQQPHIVKYSADEDDDFCGDGVVRRLQHHHPCDVTANLMLSSSSDFTGGGGIYLEACQTTVHLEQGEFLLHPGSLAHADRDISSGTRYVMVFYCHVR
jgi:predicted 2-oxoglutarate/Fe(II)-dependent dioxygenase YbiX